MILVCSSPIEYTLLDLRSSFVFASGKNPAEMACHSYKNATEFSDTIEVDLLTTQHIVATQILHVLDQRSGALHNLYNNGVPSNVTRLNKMSINGFPSSFNDVHRSLYEGIRLCRELNST